MACFVERLVSAVQRRGCWCGDRVERQHLQGTHTSSPAAQAPVGTQHRGTPVCIRTINIIRSCSYHSIPVFSGDARQASSSGTHHPSPGSPSAGSAREGDPQRGALQCSLTPWHGEHQCVSCRGDGRAQSKEVQACEEKRPRHQLRMGQEREGTSQGVGVCQACAGAGCRAVHPALPLLAP